MTTATFYKDLINAGVAPNDAQTLDDQYANEPEFLDGLEQIARMITFKEPPTLAPPVGEPWASIYTVMTLELQAGADHDSAWRAAISGFDANLQFALTSAINAGIKTIQELEQQKAKKKIKTAQYLKELKALGYTFRMNKCDDSIEVNGERITDALAAKLRCQMRDRGYIRTVEIEDAYHAEAYNNAYHPVQEYLAGLSYDGGSYIGELATYFQDDYNMFPLWLRKWLIGAVAKAFTGAQNAMLVLDGPQDIGKSSFARWICPLPAYFIESPIDPDNKDSLVMLITKFVWEVGELEGTISKASRAALKNFLTIQEVTVRKPYGHFDIRKPALASLIGTVNNSSGILNDPTGNRRFIISKITHINWDYTKLDKDRIWSEAMAAYLAGEDWRLSPDEKQIRDHINEEYQVEDPIEGILRKFFKLDTNRNDWWMSSTDIAKILEDPFQGNFRGNGSRATLMALAETMKRLGHRKGKQNNVNGYFGITVGP